MAGNIGSSQHPTTVTMAAAAYPFGCNTAAFEVASSTDVGDQHHLIMTTNPLKKKTTERKGNNSESVFSSSSFFEQLLVGGDDGDGVNNAEKPIPKIEKPKRRKASSRHVRSSFVFCGNGQLFEGFANDGRSEKIHPLRGDDINEERASAAAVGENSFSASTTMEAAAYSDTAPLGVWDPTGLEAALPSPPPDNCDHVRMVSMEIEDESDLRSALGEGESFKMDSIADFRRSALRRSGETTHQGAGANDSMRLIFDD